jgi:hypothetical protein
MCINLDKSKIIVFRNGGPLRQYEHWMYNENEIKVVSCCKYLGAYFTSELSWTKMKDVLAIQATKAVNVIYAYQKHFGYFSVNDAFKLFNARVKTYSSEISGYNTCRQIENVHISFCKRIACLNQNIAIFFALKKCGCHPISVTFMSKCVKFWLKLKEMPKYCYQDNAILYLET